MLSVIVPCFNEEDGIGECHKQLTSVMSRLQDDYELIFIDDGSRDLTYQKLLELQKNDPHTVVCALSRNFGHQQAVSAGLTVAKGDAAVIIDADLQDPPEVILEMVSLWNQGYHVVYGVREHRAGESGFKLWTASTFYRLINYLAEVKIPLDTGDFRLIDRKVIDVMNKMPERHRLLRAMYSWVGFRQIGLHYHRAARFAGSTKYPFSKMVALALDGIISFSTLPLRVLTYVGLSAAFLSFLGIFYAFGVRLLTQHWVQGWATLFIAMLFFSGLQLTSLGIMGEYLGRIYTEAKQRPLFIIRDLIGQKSRDSSKG
jgi:dolichol-phosphate mannosyltransferase